MSLTELREQAAGLSPAEQDELIRQLFVLRDGTDGANQRDIHVAWVTESARRADELLDGSVEPAPSDRVRRRTAEIIAQAK